MKRVVAIALLVVLICAEVLCPMQALAVSYVPDLMHEKPSMAEPEESWLIYDADTAKEITCSQKSADVVDLGGDCVLALTAPGNNTLIDFRVPGLSKNPIRIEDYDYDELALRLQFYVSDPTVFSANCELELTSSGTYDKMEINFSPNKHFSLQKGWNSLYLPFPEGGVKNGQLDVTNINFLRFYFFLSKEITMALDNIMIVPLEELDIHEDFSAPASKDLWISEGSTLSHENGALAMTVDGSGRISTGAYPMPVFKPGRTQLSLRLMASDSEGLHSLTLELTDTEGRVASKKLDTAALEVGAYQELSVILSELTQQKDFNFELTERIDLLVEADGAVALYLDAMSVKTYDSEYFMDWCYDYDTEPGTYSIAVIPDIQELSAKYPHKLNTIAQWIADNKAKENILFAIDLGDVTWNGHTGDTAGANSEFRVAREAFDILSAAGIEYSIAYGNHDYTPAGQDTTMFNRYFPLSLFQSFDSFGGTMDATKSDNTYYTFRGGNTDYLVLALEYTPTNAAIAWADSVVQAHPDHQVIVTTHGYMQGDSAASVKDENALAPAVGADRLWNQLLKKYENILMLICGHAWSKSYSGDLVMRRDQGDHGNTVYQIMANAQDIDASRAGVGMLLMLRFSEDGSMIDFNWFSPVSGYAFREKNQFKLDLNNEIGIQGIEKDKTYCGPVSFTVTSGTTVTVKDGSKILKPDENGVYTLSGRDGKRRVTLVDPFGEVLSSTVLTVREGHSGDEATCISAATCEVCGETYGDLAPHDFGEDDTCRTCGEKKPREGGCGSAVQPGAALLLAFSAMTIAAVKKKRKFVK